MLGGLGGLGGLVSAFIHFNTIHCSQVGADSGFDDVGGITSATNLPVVVTNLYAGLTLCVFAGRDSPGLVIFQFDGYAGDACDG